MATNDDLALSDAQEMALCHLPVHELDHGRPRLSTLRSLVRLGLANEHDGEFVPSDRGREIRRVLRDAKRWRP